MIFPHPFRRGKAVSPRLGRFLLIGGLLLVLGILLVSLWLFGGAR